MKIRLALVFLLLPALAFAQDVGKIAAHPAMWTVHGKAGTVYLFGSIHLLPPNIAWHSKDIDAALGAADTFVFEAPTDADGMAEAKAYIDAHGNLPAGESLRADLPPDAQADYDAALAKAHIAPASLDNRRPWLASLVIQLTVMSQENYAPDSGVDHAVIAFANAQHKPLRYFETVDQQFALMDPPDNALALKEFAIDLKSMREDPTTIGALVDAWAAGDEDALGRLMNSDLAKDPGAKKIMLDDRNKAWVTKIDAMLDEPHIFFITVGAAHLAGPDGVPALLRKQGYQVDGP